jgi:Cu+-exporting ATPase
MTCGSCAVRVQKALAKQPGVVEAEVNLATAKAHVSGSETIDPEGLQTAVDRIGYRLHPVPSRPPAGPGDATPSSRTPARGCGA